MLTIIRGWGKNDLDINVFNNANKRTKDTKTQSRPCYRHDNRKWGDKIVQNSVLCWYPFVNFIFILLDIEWWPVWKTSDFIKPLNCWDYLSEGQFWSDRVLDQCFTLNLYQWEARIQVTWSLRTNQRTRLGIGSVFCCCCYRGKFCKVLQKYD